MARTLPAWLLAAALCVGGLLPACLPPAGAQGMGASAGSEERVKAAYLFRMLNYIDYPPQAFERPNAPYVIGVMDDEVVAQELTQLVAGKQVGGREIGVRRVGAGAGLGGLQVLFISRAQRTRQGAILRQLRAAPVFTVTETPDGLEHGSILNFRIVEGHVRFEISLPAAEQSGIKLSSRLLGLATKVVKPD
jgi:hypothetical protein